MSDALTLKDARKIVDAITEESERRGLKTAVAVVDERGDMILVARVDGARFYYPDVAYGKAMGSAMWQESSRVLSQRSATNSVQQRVNSLSGGRIVFAPGAVPLVRDGRVVGAVGVGGSGPDSDEELANLGAAALQ